jgi:hypothetical protein
MLRDAFSGVVAFLFEKKRDKGKKRQVEGMEDEREGGERESAPQARALA